MRQPSRHRSSASHGMRSYRRAVAVVVLLAAGVISAMWMSISYAGSLDEDLAVEQETTDEDGDSTDDDSSLRKQSVTSTYLLEQKQEEAAAALSAEVQEELDGVFAGAEYAVDVVDLSSGATSIEINADEVFVSASTYKLYVAYSMLSAVDSGTMTWESELNGTTLGECFAQMIEISDNACPEAWLYDVSSRDEVTAQAHSIGATSTAFVDGQAATTTASDLATMLTGVYEGTLLSQSSSETLIDEMMSQVYREGIPAGIGDAGVVADKVGFLYGYLNDAGIVYSDKGDYVFVILTNNSSWAAIAEATAIIYDALPEA
ncbi:beta-lactamase [Bifidobacterium lemurum]|uniref:Beta-lactamase n=1 Tax=Bifidobacterium lemurum TaxID=1603886 RepID=A0A261FP86_9BIFI|nr:serine hydrolase [Bifidobacterium lemurum]OZG60990.1 beta-lactamase [Bifidobacterium lemurum]QOL34784.1 serine hydrolase [Bifidobacterium lemurum]